jgi:hypothetical protein
METEGLSGSLARTVYLLRYKGCELDSVELPRPRAPYDADRFCKLIKAARPGDKVAAYGICLRSHEKQGWCEPFSQLG